MKRLQHLFVNWVDGMKISKDHFIATELAVRDHVRDAVMAGLADHHYGFIEPPVWEADERQARLLSCRALCRDGSRMELLPEQEQQVGIDLAPMLKPDLEGRSFYLLAMLQPEQREGLGPFVGEPPRQATVVPKVSLQLLPVEKLNAAALRSAMLPVARFTVLQGRPAFNKDFVPPALTIDGFAAWEKLRKDLGTTMELMLRNAARLLEKLWAKPRDIQARFPNRCYEHWAVQTQLALPAIQAALLVGTDRPCQLLRAVVQLACTNAGLWQSMPEREKLLDHVKGVGNWAELIRQQQAATTELMQLRYAHGDPAATLALCTRFLELGRQTYAQLGELASFEPVTLGRDVAPETVVELKVDVPPPPPEKKGFVWERKRN